MNRLINYFLIFLLLPVFLSSCSNSVNNSITFQNLASGDVYINFRGGLITVPAGQTSSIKEIPSGIYSYSTTYSVPAGATSSSSQGNLMGTLNIKAGTKILFVYSSTLQTGVYTISITISNSDDQSKTNPTFP
ncbi:MAG: hypothetical protein ACYCVH_00740 [Ignavibacteriaceae bacterium]